MNIIFSNICSSIYITDPKLSEQNKKRKAPFCFKFPSCISTATRIARVVYWIGYGWVTVAALSYTVITLIQLHIDKKWFDEKAWTSVSQLFRITSKLYLTYLDIHSWAEFQPAISLSPTNDLGNSITKAWTLITHNLCKRQIARARPWMVLIELMWAVIEHNYLYTSSSIKTTCS